MLSRFFGERIGGVRFFEELDRRQGRSADQLRAARADARLPGARLPGHPPHLGRRRRATADDPAQPLRDAAPGEARPTTNCRRAGRARPRRATARAAGAGLGGRLGRRRSAARRSTSCCAPCSAAESDAVASRALLSVHPHERDRDPAPAVSAAAAAAAAAARPQLERICARPSRPPSSCRGDAAASIIIRMSNLALFASGERDGARRVQAADRQHRRRARKGAGPDQDRRPYRQRADPQRPLPVELRSSRSSARKAVADLIKGQIIASRTASAVDGKGADMPIAPNDNRRGRAKNRRVEILIQRTSDGGGAMNRTQPG